MRSQPDTTLRPPTAPRDRRVRGVCALVLALTAALTVSGAPPAWASHACGPAMVEWAERCGQQVGATVTAAACHAEAVRLAVRGPVELDVELGTATATSFEQVGDVAVSPVGEFGDWQRQPQPLRATFARIVSCVEAQRPPFGAGQVADGDPGWSALLPLGLLELLAIVGVWVGVLWRRRTPGLRTDVSLAGLIALVAFAARGALAPAAFFQQNGHGPMWVEYAWCGQSPYGHGYEHLFGFAAALGATAPEHGIFLLQQVVGALAVACMFAAVRIVAGSRLLAAAAAIALAAQPLVARMSRSESYYGAILSLVIIAVALLATLVRWDRPWRSPAAWVVGLCAGCAAALACAIHPIAWIPVAVVPQVLVLGPGGRKARMQRLLFGGGLFTAVVATLAIGVVVDVLGGDIGQAWSREEGPHQDIPLLLVRLVAPVLVALLAPPPHGRLLGGAAVVLVACFLNESTNMFGVGSPIVQSDAWAFLFGPVMVVAAADLAVQAARLFSRGLGERVRAWALASVAALGLVLAAVYGVREFERQTRVPTDALEAGLLAPEIAKLPMDAAIVALTFSGQRVSALPLYEGCGGETRTHVRLGQALTRPERLDEQGSLYYYRSSLCSAASGAAKCREMEAHLALEPIYEAELPVVPSYTDPDDGYVADPIRVGLYRARRRS